MKDAFPSDVAEMIARGYDSSTIVEAICRDIETAFSGIRLGEGIGLREAQGVDDYEDPSACAAFRATDEKNDWHCISADTLNRCHSSLSYFDAEGMRFHLPAFLLADLRGDFEMSGLVFSLTHRWENFEMQYSLLSREQRSVVRNYLLYMVNHPDHSFESRRILRSINEYWIE